MSVSGRPFVPRHSFSVAHWSLEIRGRARARGKPVMLAAGQATFRLLDASGDELRPPVKVPLALLGIVLQPDAGK